MKRRLDTTHAADERTRTAGWGITPILADLRPAPSSVADIAAEVQRVAQDAVRRRRAAAARARARSRAASRGDVA